MIKLLLITERIFALALAAVKGRRSNLTTIAYKSCMLEKYHSFCAPFNAITAITATLFCLAMTPDHEQQKLSASKKLLV